MAKFCTCETKKPRGSYDHAQGCDFFKVRPETKDEKIARLEKELHARSASEMLLCLIMDRKAEPVEVSVETYDDPPQIVAVKVYPQRRDDGIVWDGHSAHWLGSWSRCMAESHHYYLRDLASKANEVYEKHWNSK